ncbi:MAG: spore coat protein U [Proteobacteria bacterium]|nr:MAG: spore coat protein U [Pseudomonadota bacterium]
MGKKAFYPVAALALLSGAADAASPATTQFQVTMTIQDQCVINSAPTLDFGTSGVLTAAVTQSSTIQIQCTNTTPYTIALDAGTGSGATVGTRKMTNGSATINYSLYTDSNYNTVWGNTPGTDAVGATGNGANQSYVIYGQVPAQTTPKANAYSDTITITVAY